MKNEFRIIQRRQAKAMCHESVADTRATSTQGALIAAMSSYKLGNMDQAQQFATQASSAQDRNVSGGALVLLGDIKLSQQHPKDAAVYYSQAAAKLSGTDAVRARDCAERARKMAEVPTIATVALRGKERDKSEDAEIAPAPAWTLQPKMDLLPSQMMVMVLILLNIQNMMFGFPK